jgi:lipoate-protein ligase A
MQFIPYELLNGSENMALDEKLLDEAIKSNSEPILRFYGWLEPTLTFGKNQQKLEFLNLPSIRRITGGRALLHDKELTYCFICHKSFLENGDSVINSYKQISNGLILGFKELGIELDYPSYQKVSAKSGYCMNLATGSDLSYQGKKLIGSAQARKRSYILQHGSILFDYDKELLERIFAEKIDKIISLKEINPNLCNIELLCDALKRGFEKNFNVK